MLSKKNDIFTCFIKWIKTPAKTQYEEVLLEIASEIIPYIKVSATSSFLTSRACKRCRSSHLKMFFKKGVLKNFAILAGTGKHLCWSSVMIKLLTFRPATLLKRYSSTGIFPWISRNF